METIRYEVRDGVAEITLARPDRLNAFDLTMIRELREAVAAASDDGSVGALLLTGEGRAFCSGLDLTSTSELAEGESIGGMIQRGMEEDLGPLVIDLVEHRVPVVCAVNGVAAGGGMGLALSGDVVIAARTAEFIQVFAPRLAVVPDTGSTWWLARLLTRAQARGLALLGEPLSAVRALSWGLVWDVVDDDLLLDVARGIAGRLADGPTEAYRHTRALLDAAGGLPLADALQAEAEANGVLCDQPDFLEGVSAFLEKRRPVFGSAPQA